MFKNKNQEKLIIPKNIGIIMDGNGRWAQKRGLPRQAGHIKGAKTFKKIVSYANKLGIKHLTVYAFSTENWKRPQKEIDAIMNLLRQYLDDSKNYKHENVRTRFIGDLSVLDKDIIEKIDKTEKDSEDFTGLTLNIAVNYGGRDEILNATKIIANKVENNEINIDDINTEMIKSNLYTKNQPDVDLIIRPSGEKRISNFLIWQSAYAEFIFMDVLWPDFNEKHFDKALKEFSNRNRRFGGV